MTDWVTAPSGIKYFDFRRSDGTPITLGDRLEIHYRIALTLDQIEKAPG